MKFTIQRRWGLLAALLFWGVGASFAEGSTQKAYIGLFKESAVAVLDVKSGAVLRKIDVPKGPHGMALSADDRTVYVSSDGASEVSVIDTATDRVRDSITVGKSPHGLALAPDGTTLLVAGFGYNAVTLISTKDDTILGQIPVANPHNIAVTPDGTTAYVASQKAEAPALVVLDLGHRTSLRDFPLPSFPRALNVSPDGKKLYFTEVDSDAVHVLDIGTGAMTEIPVGAAPHHVLFTADGQALVVSQGTGTLSVLRPSDGIAAVITVGTLPHWIALGPGETAWVTNETSGDVSVIDLKKRTVTTYPVGNGPRKLVVQKRGAS